MDDVTVHICQSAVNAVVPHGELFVVDSQLVQDRGVDVVARGWVILVGRAESPLVTLPVGHASTDTTAGEPVGENKRIMVTPLAALSAGHAAKLGRPKNKRILEHTALLEVEYQRGAATGHATGKRTMVAPNVLVRIPVASGEAVVVAGPDLDEAGTAFE